MSYMCKYMCMYTKIVDLRVCLGSLRISITQLKVSLALFQFILCCGQSLLDIPHIVLVGLQLTVNLFVLLCYQKNMYI